MSDDDDDKHIDLAAFKERLQKVEERTSKLGGGWRQWMAREYGRKVSEAELEAHIEHDQRNERKEFGQNLARMSDEELYEARKQAVRIRQKEEFKEAWPSMDILLELLTKFIAARGPSE
jgi:hypothetical protein